MRLLISNKIKQDKYFVFTIISIFTVVLWYVNFINWHSYFVYGLSLVLYGLINSLWLGKILSRFGFEKELQFILGIFLLIFLIAFGMAIPIVLYKVSPVYLFGLLLFLTLIISFWSKTIKTRNEVSISSLDSNIEKGRAIFKLPGIIYIFLFLVWAFSFFLLFYARTGEYIRSPWTVIHPVYLYCWLSIVFIVGLLIFSKIKLKHFLLLIILSSLLLHAYLLIPYEMGFGGDKWRHIGAERWLAQGNIYTPALFGEEISYKEFGPIKVPEVFVAGNKTSYANMWGIVIALSWLTGLNVFWIDLILGVLLFSIFLPFLLLKIGTFISLKKEFLYLLVFSPFLFYPFQAYGSITVPMSFAFLPFVFALIFLFKYFLERSSSKKLFLYLVVFIPFLYFNYILYLVLFLEALLLVIFLKNISIKGPSAKKTILPFFIICIILLLLFIPFLDMSNQFSWFKYPNPTKTEIIHAIKDFPQRLLFSFAIFPRIYQLEQDNWLYAIVEQHFSRSAFVRILPWSFILTPLVWFLVIFGICHYRKLRQPKIGLILILMLVISLINQMIATYFMDGNHIFSKRLVTFISFLIFIPLCWGIYQLIKKLSRKIFSRQATTLTLILLLALISTTVYASGPKFQVVTADESKSAEYIWNKVQTNPSNVCVLANTWPLLVLEAVSSRHITTGGFPYYHEYRQPERVQLFANMNNNPSVRYLEKSLAITGAQQCYFMTEKRWIEFNKRDEVVLQLDKILGPHKKVGKVMLWLYHPNTL